MNYKTFTRFLIAVIITFSFFNKSYSQSVNNMTLLGNKNDFTTGGTPTGFRYASCWGYTAPNGREYAIIGHYAGTTVYDITDAPIAIPSKGTIAGPGSYYNYREFKTYSHYLYIVSEGAGYVQIVDLQYLPDSLHFVKNYTFTGLTNSHSISQEGRYLYLNGANVGNGGVMVLDCLDPENPVKRGQWTTRYVHDCIVRNDTIYAACVYNGYLSILNATNKDNITLIHEFTYPGAVTHNAALTDDAKYLVTTDEGGSNHAKIWDIHNVNAQVQISDINPYEVAMVHNAYIRGDSLYLAHYRAGVIVYNIQNRANPIEVGHYDTYPGSGTAYQGCWNVYPYFPSKKIIASDISTGLYVMKLNNATNINNQISNIANSYLLSQNYPNPFNPTTNIRFALPKNTYVKLKIFNPQGKQEAELVDGDLSRGTYEINVDAGKLNLSSGTYFYTLLTEDFKETKRMVLIK